MTEPTKSDWTAAEEIVERFSPCDRKGYVEPSAIAAIISTHMAEEREVFRQCQIEWTKCGDSLFEARQVLAVSRDLLTGIQNAATDTGTEIACLRRLNWQLVEGAIALNHYDPEKTDQRCWCKDFGHWHVNPEVEHDEKCKRMRAAIAAAEDGGVRIE